LIEHWLLSIRYVDGADRVTMAAYLLSALFAAQATSLARTARRVREGQFWCLAAMLLVALGINELLDLQTLVTEIIRAQAKASGWYEERREAQHAFVLSLAAASVLTAGGLLWLTRREALSVRLALVGLISIGSFVLLRAASFHHADHFLGRGAVTFNWGSILELAGIAIVATGAALYCRKHAS
jgi:hypothetical protein